MEKSTVLARLRFTVRLNDAAQAWLRRFPDAWFAREQGSLFLDEYSNTWERLLVSATQREVQEFFLGLGIPPEQLPRVEAGDHFRGSWIMDAMVVMSGTVPTVYALFKGASELPKIAEGLSALKEKTIGKLRAQLDAEVQAKLLEAQKTRQPAVPTLQAQPGGAPPANTVALDLVIDARPILALSPGVTKTHELHMSVAVSRSSLTVENLGDTAMRDLRLGLFGSPTELNSWFYAQAFSAQLPLLSARQTAVLKLSDFRNSNGAPFDISHGRSTYVDCWVQNTHGIFLFRFFLEPE